MRGGGFYLTIFRFSGNEGKRLNSFDAGCSPPPSSQAYRKPALRRSPSPHSLRSCAWSWRACHAPGLHRASTLRPCAPLIASFLKTFLKNENYVSPHFKRPALDCIGADSCEQLLIFQHYFSRSTRFPHPSTSESLTPKFQQKSRLKFGSFKKL